jgi:hypothetical protein
MKLLMEQWKKYLAEIGDSSVEPYPFKLHRQFNDGDVFFEFKSGTGSQYYVNFAQSIGPPGEVPWEISFDVDDSIEMTNENEPLKIMSTIVAVIKEFIATPQYNKGTLKFVFEGTRKGAEFLMPMEKPTSRTKLYTRFLKKNMPPGTKVEEIGNVVKFEVPSEEDKE